MSFSYSPDLSIPMNYVRRKIGDVEEEYAIFQDEEIQYFIDKYPSPQTEKDLNKASIHLLKLILQDLLRGPSRERTGAYEVYAATSESLRLYISMIEDEIKAATGYAAPSFGGVYKTPTVANRHNDSYTKTYFYHGRVYRWNGNDYEPFFKRY